MITVTQDWLDYFGDSTFCLIRLDFTLSNGGIGYAVNRMDELKKQAIQGLPAFIPSDIRNALISYLELITNRAR